VHADHLKLARDVPVAIRYFAGVDGGTGDTECVVIDEQGSLLGRGHGGPSRDPDGPRMHEDIDRNLVQAIRDALVRAGLQGRHLASISLNLSGGNPQELNEAQARAWLAPLNLNEDYVLEFEEDGVSAWAAGDYPDPSIWNLLGTHWGSEGMLNGQKIEHPLDRLDLDAENGALAEGANLGTRALSQAIHSRLGGAPTRLLDAYCLALNAHDATGLIEWARAHPRSDERADLYRVAAEVAAMGDPVATEIFESAGVGIGRATIAMAHYMGLKDRPVVILLTGKAWHAGYVLMEPFTRVVNAALPHAEIVLNPLSQAQGSALLAMRAIGLMPGPNVYRRLAETSQPPWADVRPPIRAIRA
jgi:N-acetylglucosamine kinase-like BadF-type ATPase